MGQSNSPSENYLFLNVMVNFVIVNQKLTGSALHIEKNQTIKLCEMNCCRILLQDSISDFIKWQKNINHIHSNKRTCSNKPTPCNVHMRTFAGLAYWYMTPSFTHRHRIGHIKTLKLNHKCLNIFLAHLSRRLTGELIVYPCSGVRPSSSIHRPQFQRSSPLKLLGQSKPNFMWSILRKGERKCI